MGEIFVENLPMSSNQATQTPSRKWVTIVMHIGVWCVFLGTPLLFSPADAHGPFGITPPAENIRQWVALAINGLLVSFFYTNFALLIPRYYLKRKLAVYFFTVFCFFIFYQLGISLVREVVFSSITNQTQFQLLTQASILVTSLFFLVMWGVSSGLRIAQEWKKVDAERKENERKRLEAELALLKSQINPHFLLNTLNNLYTISITENEKTPEAINKLAEMVKYILHDCTSPYTTLAKETAFIRNYLDLQRLRLSENVHLKVELPSKQGLDHAIEPMLLISFIENAFKHGITTTKHIQIEIRVSYLAGVLHLHVENPIIHQKKDVKESVAGLGVLNTKQRLQSAYRDNHTLLMSKTKDVFTVDLKIRLS